MNKMTKFSAMNKMIINQSFVSWNIRASRYTSMFIFTILVKGNNFYDFLFAFLEDFEALAVGDHFFL